MIGQSGLAAYLPTRARSATMKFMAVAIDSGVHRSAMLTARDRAADCHRCVLNFLVGDSAGVFRSFHRYLVFFFPFFRVSFFLSFFLLVSIPIRLAFEIRASRITGMKANADQFSRESDTVTENGSHDRNYRDKSAPIANRRERERERGEGQETVTRPRAS